MAQINRTIELVRYRKYGDSFIVLELVNAVVGTPAVEAGSTATKAKVKSVSDYLVQSSVELQDLYLSMEDFLIALGDDVTKKVLQDYIAFRRIKNFACVEAHPQAKKLVVYLKVDPTSIKLEEGFTRDVQAIGHWGTGDLEVTVTSPDDLEHAKPLLIASYENS